MANNNAIFNAVLAGATGGSQERWITNTSPDSYTAFKTAVLEIAAEVDYLIPPDSINSAEAQLMQSIAQGVFANRYPQASEYSSVAQAIVTLYEALQSSVLPVAGGISPLSNVFYIDGGAASEGDGSIGSPYKTITQALSEHGAGGTFYLTPFDYQAAEPTLTIPGTIKVQLIGMSNPGEGNAFFGIKARIGGIVQATGGEQGSLVLQNLECAGNLEIGLSLLAIDCEGVFVIGEGDDLGFVEIRGGTVGGITCGGLLGLSGCTLGSGAGISVQTSIITLVDCKFAGVGIEVTFSEPGGLVVYDLITEQNGSGFPLGSVTNGTGRRASLPIQSITGATTQEQVDSIITAGVTLKLWTDDR